MDTLDELYGKLISQVDMIDLLDLLDISVKDLLERFEDRVMIHQDKIEEFLDDSPR